MIFLQLTLCADSFFGLVSCDVSTCGMSSSLFILAHVCCSVVCTRPASFPPRWELRSFPGPTSRSAMWHRGSGLWLQTHGPSRVPVPHRCHVCLTTEWQTALRGGRSKRPASCQNSPFYHRVSVEWYFKFCVSLSTGDSEHLCVSVLWAGGILFFCGLLVHVLC